METPYYDIERSLGRCALANGFAARFFEILFDSEPAFCEKFAKFDVDKRHALFGLTINAILVYAQNRPANITKIRQAKTKYLLTELSMDSGSCTHLVNSIIQVVSEFDQEYTPVIEKQWREVLQLAVNTSRGDLSGTNIIELNKEDKQSQIIEEYCSTR